MKASTCLQNLRNSPERRHYFLPLQTTDPPGLWPLTASPSQSTGVMAASSSTEGSFTLLYIHYYSICFVVQQPKHREKGTPKNPKSIHFISNLIFHRFFAFVFCLSKKKRCRHTHQARVGHGSRHAQHLQSVELAHLTLVPGLECLPCCGLEHSLQLSSLGRPLVPDGRVQLRAGAEGRE